MKKIYLLVLFVFGFSAFAQQKGISYQAVIINPKAVAAPGYNGSSIPLANKSICLSFQIVNSANQVEYQESHSITTDAYGMVNVVIGTGTSGSGLVANLDAVNWNQGSKKLVVGVNTDGVCSNYTEISNQVLNYTPYSFYAQNADIKDGYVTTAKLADGAVTDAKVAMGINPAKVGLGNVNNTTDANKPVSTAAQTALNLKANTTDVTTSLALKEDVSNKSNAILGSSTTLYPTQNAVKTYVDSQISSATIVDADATTKGKIKLAGDLAGTADLPTVPGLALKADTSSLSPVATSGNYNDLTNKPSIPSAYALPTASASVLGGVKVGANLSIDANGVLSASGGNNVSSLTGVLPIANGGTGTTTIAGIKSVLGFNSSKVAIGDQAGQTNQADGSVGVGGGAGFDNQGGSAVAIGYVAGYNNQGASSVAIGPNAAQSGQGSSAVAIGFAAGQNGQGANSVAIGSFAGITQVANSIAINATGISTPLNPTNSGFYVSPVRNASESNSLFYNTTTKEITYGTAAPSGPLNLATGVTGILPIANGGTGATTLTGLVKGNGTSALTAAVSGTDYQEPITLTTTGSGAATLTGNTLNIPSTTNYTLPTSSASVLGGVKVGTNLSIDSNGILSSASSPTFTGTVTAPIYASLPQALTAGATITWNPANGLNASVTLDQNSTLSFTTTPTAGSYGTLVVSQDVTGGRTLTLPSTTNKVLGSTSTTTIALSTTANAKDILNFYYDGTNCYWNIGQGYGTAATAAITNLATSVSGTLPVANGGTGAATLTGLVKGNGTNAMTAATAGTDYLAPTGSASSLTNFPTFNQNTTGTAANVTGTVSVANGGTGATTATTALANLTGIQAANKVLAGPATNLLLLGNYDGTSLTGWTATGGASLDTGTFKVTGGNQSMYRDLGQNFKNKTVQFDVKITAGNTGFTIGAAADGSGGLGVTLRAGTSNLNGLRSTTNWFYTNAGGDTFTFTAGTWYTIKIVTDNGSVAGTSWYINGVLAGNSGGYYIDNGTYFGIASDDATANFDNISISGVSNATDATPTFRTLVAADIPTLNQNTTGTAANVTGTVSVTNGGTGATSLTANNVLLGNGTSALQVVAPGTIGNVLTSNGTTWSSSAPAASGVPYTGATQAVNLGAYDLTVNGLTVGKGKIGSDSSRNPNDNAYNTAFGVNALSSFNAGTKNTALGYYALSSITNGDQNIGIGTYALGSTNADFQQSVAVGNQALQYNRGSFNTALGSGALSGSGLTNTATYMVGVGALALMNNTSGQNNTGVGSYALSTNTSGNNNTALGQGADVLSATLDNATAIGYDAKVGASNSIQLGNTSVSNVKTSGTLTAGTVTYPNAHGTANQVLSTSGSGTLTWSTPAVAKPISDQFTATAAQTSFTLSQTPITNTTVSPNVKPNVWMYINGIRTNNLAYSVSGTTVTYTAANNNSYALVVGDRIQFDYAY